MNIEHTIETLKKIAPIIKSDTGTVIEPDKTNETISSISFNIRALKHWATTSLLACNGLSEAKFNRAKDYLSQTLDEAVDIICEKMEYVEYNEKAITDLDIGNTLRLYSDKYIHLAVSKGWIIHVDLLNREEQTRIEYYCFPDDVEYDSNSGIYYKDVEQKIMPQTLTEDDVLDYFKDEFIDEIICDAAEIYANKNSIAADMIFEIRALQGTINKPISQEYKTHFLNQVELYTTPPKRAVKDLSAFFIYEDIDKFERIMKPILSGKKGRKVAVVLRALEELSLINLEAENKTDLYTTLRNKMNIDCADQGINMCLQINNKRADEIRKEVPILKRALEIQ